MPNRETEPVPKSFDTPMLQSARLGLTERAWLLKCPARYNQIIPKAARKADGAGG